PLEVAMCLKVDRGSNFDRVADTLEAEGAIFNRTLFRIAVDYAERGDDLKAGAYLIPAGASMKQITDTVTSTGRSTCGTEIVYRIGVTRTTVQVRELNPATNRFDALVTFNPAEEDLPAAYTMFKEDSSTRFRIAMAEGITSWQIVDGLKSIDILAGNPTDIPAEGSLAPDSFDIGKGDDRLALLDQMQAIQKRRVAQAWENRADDAPVSTPEEMVILASIIEKETAISDERGQVASVFANRLVRGMRLQTDPTVIYGITKGEGTLGRGLRQSELRRATPWNTYTIDGLPPTPIANPGLASLQAAVAPDETDFIFFVADGTGGHAFAETLAEHNRNVAVWRQIETDRANN
ncbi:MAG: endolytic transglycosylase MltG, partial [Planktomarina sp.]